MKYQIDRQPKYLLITLLEEKLDSLIAPELKSEFVKLNTDGSNYILLDLTSTNYIDSSGLSAILVGNRLCTNSKGMMVIAGASEHAMKLIKISQLDTVLTLLPTVEEGIDAIFLHQIETELNQGE